MTGEAEELDLTDPDGRSSACVGAVLSGRVDARPGDWRRPPNPRPHAGRPPRRRDRGSTTAELAVALPALMVLLIVGVLAVKAVAVKLQCVSAAREGALGAARGDSGEAAARRTAPDGASVSVAVAGEQARATVSAPVQLLGATFTVGATSTAAVEPGQP
ncbi:TadE family type IV pilus minor pilin [Virgisporangium aurantiacum]|uniref:TadE-like domain-containing protein n=1 Tax=Virgisporangium aurantiacum TaxID=175570 RepID=A0A8J3ZH09_9ACTN|nr:TadE family type IV pilus minor pilin [Virgisporangium aurantiacum]GIJ61740.1 hypothetical protein Vau01_092560 [Virgisporangium aurantiacum]